jgi:hypothetical protein
LSSIAIPIASLASDHRVEYELHLKKYRGTRDGNKDPAYLEIEKVRDYLKVKMGW